MDSKTAEKVAKQALDTGYATATVSMPVKDEYVVACATSEGGVALFVAPADWELLSVTILDRQVGSKWQRATWYPEKGQVLFGDSWAKIPNFVSHKLPTVPVIERWVATFAR